MAFSGRGSVFFSPRCQHLLEEEKMRKVMCAARILSVAAIFAAGPVYAGSISGKVMLNGVAPASEAIDMSADPTCEAFYDEPLRTEDVVVNDDGSLRNVFVYVKEGLEGKTYAPPAEAVRLNQHGCHYTPHVFGVMVNQPIEIMNSDSTLHNVHALPEQSRPFNLGMPIQGMKLKKKFDTPEVMVRLKCDVHPWMSAYAGVLEHPYHAVSGDGGAFEITGLPAGTYVLEAWHEVYGTLAQQVTVDEAGSASASFTFTA